MTTNWKWCSKIEKSSCDGYKYSWVWVILVLRHQTPCHRTRITNPKLYGLLLNTGRFSKCEIEHFNSFLGVFWSLTIKDLTERKEDNRKTAWNKCLIEKKIPFSERNKQWRRRNVRRANVLLTSLPSWLPWCVHEKASFHRYSRTSFERPPSSNKISFYKFTWNQMFFFYW